jgi:hypothetical protein
MALSPLILAFSLFLSSTATASPILPRQSPLPEYHLKTRTIDTLSNKNGLYVAGYHTGAGLNDAVLITDMARASKGFLTGDHQQFDFGTLFPWSLVLGGVSNYAGMVRPTVLDISTRDGTLLLRKMATLSVLADPSNIIHSLAAGANQRRPRDTGVPDRERRSRLGWQCLKVRGMDGYAPRPIT